MFGIVLIIRIEDVLRVPELRERRTSLFHGKEKITQNVATIRKQTESK